MGRKFNTDTPCVNYDNKAIFGGILSTLEDFKEPECSKVGKMVK